MAHTTSPIYLRANNSQRPTIIEFLLDETGSMCGIEPAVINGFNDFLAEQKTLSSKCLLTLTKFDTLGQKTPYVDLDINMVPNLTYNTFCPNASTNLNDTIYNRIISVKERISTWKEAPNVLFVVMTDGYDNASNLKSWDVKNMILEASGAGWAFVFLGAHKKSFEQAYELGFDEKNTKMFEPSQMRETLQEMSTATKAYRMGGSGQNMFA